MIAVMMNIPRAPDAEGDELFKRFVKETPGVLHAYQLERLGAGAAFTVWESQEARDAYMQSGLRSEIDTALSGVTRTVYTVRNSK